MNLVDLMEFAYLQKRGGRVQLIHLAIHGSAKGANLMSSEANFMAAACFPVACPNHPDATYPV